MPAPSTSLATLRPDLGGSLEEFDLQADRQGFIGLRVLPVMEVAKQTSTFGKIPLKQLLEHPDTRRAPGANYNRVEWQFTTDSYACEEHGITEPIDDREAKMYAEYFDAEQVAARRARDIVLRAYEIRVAEFVFDASTWTPASAAVAWATVASATPIVDVDTAVNTAWGSTGLWPNALIISRKVYRNLRRTAEILDKVKYVRGTLPAEIGVSELQDAFDLPHILVGGSAKNTADKGQDASVGAIWSDDYAMVARIITSNDIREPGLGRTFHWSEDGSTIGATMETYRDENSRSDIVRARMDTDEKILYTNAGELIDITP